MLRNHDIMFCKVEDGCTTNACESGKACKYFCHKWPDMNELATEWKYQVPVDGKKRVVFTKKWDESECKYEAAWRGPIYAEDIKAGDLFVFDTGHGCPPDSYLPKNHREAIRQMPQKTLFEQDVEDTGELPYRGQWEAFW